MGKIVVLRVPHNYIEYKLQERQRRAVPKTSAVQNNFNKVKNDVNKLNTVVKKQNPAYQAGLYALSPIPTVRRIGSLPDSIKEDNWARAVLLVGLAAANFPRDFQEMKEAYRELKGNSKGFKQFFSNIVPNFRKTFHNKMNTYQRPQTIIHETFASRIIRKFPWLAKIDKTLDETDVGKFIMRKIFKIPEPEVDFIKGTQAFDYAGNRIQRLVGRAHARTAVIGVILTSLLEVPAIIKAIKQGDTSTEKSKSISKQVCKSTAYIGLTTAGIALGGAAAATVGGTLLSLVGMGIGSSLALIASNQVNKFVDKVIT